MSAEASSPEHAAQPLVDVDHDEVTVDSEKSGAEPAQAQTEQDAAHSGPGRPDTETPEGVPSVPFRPRGPPSKPASGRPAVKPKPKPKPK